MDIGIFDLETSNLKADYGVILAGVIKDFRGEAHVFRMDGFPLWRKNRADDTAIIKAIRDKLSNYDIWVSYNGRRFDIPFLNTRLVYHEMEPLGIKKHIDLLYQSRYKLLLHSSRLISVQEFFRLENEKNTIDGNHWARALAGYKDGMNYIVDHCERDVAVLEEVYEKMKQFVGVVHA